MATSHTPEKIYNDYRQMVERAIDYTRASNNKAYQERALVELLTTRAYVPRPGSNQEWKALFDVLIDNELAGIPAMLLEKITRSRDVAWVGSALRTVPLYLMVEMDTQGKVDFLDKQMGKMDEKETIEIIQKVVGSVQKNDQAQIGGRPAELALDIALEQTAKAMARHPGLAGKLGVETRQTLIKQVDLARPRARPAALRIKRALLEELAKNNESVAGKGRVVNKPAF